MKANLFVAEFSLAGVLFQLCSKPKLDPLEQMRASRHAGRGSISVENLPFPFLHAHLVLIGPSKFADVGRSLVLLVGDLLFSEAYFCTTVRTFEASCLGLVSTLLPPTFCP